MSDAISKLLGDPAVTAVGTAVAGAAVALWVAAAWWAYSDAQRRTDSTLAAMLVAAWVVVSTPLLLPLSLAIYTLARPQQTAAEHRTRNLARELVGIAELSDAPRCPACRTETDPSWLRCPLCSSWLAAPCADCGGWSEWALPACPWCGGEDREDPKVEPLETPDAARQGRLRRARRSHRGFAPGAQGGRPLTRRVIAHDGRPLAPIRGH